MGNRGYMPPVRRSAWRRIAREWMFTGKALALLPHPPAPRQPAVSELTVTLVAEPKNPRDPQAVAVQHGGTKLGYLPLTSAPHYRRALELLAAQNTELELPARINAYLRSDGTTNVAVSVALPHPEHLIPANSQHTPNTSVLPWGPAVPLALADEEGTAQLGKAIVCKYADRSLLVTLHETGQDETGQEAVRVATDSVQASVRQGTDAGRSTVAVRLDGENVGELPSSLLADLLPLVREAAQAQRTVGLWASVDRVVGEQRAALNLHVPGGAELRDFAATPARDFPNLVAEPAQNATAEVTAEVIAQSDPLQAPVRISADVSPDAAGKTEAVISEDAAPGTTLRVGQFSAALHGSSAPLLDAAPGNAVNKLANDLALGADGVAATLEPHFGRAQAFVDDVVMLMGEEWHTDSDFLRRRAFITLGAGILVATFLLATATVFGVLGAGAVMSLSVSHAKELRQRAGAEPYPRTVSAAWNRALVGLGVRDEEYAPAA